VHEAGVVVEVEDDSHGSARSQAGAEDPSGRNTRSGQGNYGASEPGATPSGVKSAAEADPVRLGIDQQISLSV
jgi:hypothetical protein